MILYFTFTRLLDLEYFYGRENAVVQFVVVIAVRF